MSPVLTSTQPNGWWFMRRLVAVATVALAVVGAMLAPDAARAQAVMPEWLPVIYGPDRVEPGTTFTYRISPTNVGEAATDGTAVLDIALPTGVTGVAVAGSIMGPGTPPLAWACDDPAGASSIHCVATFPVPVQPDQMHPEELLVTVAADGVAAESGVATFELSGGGVGDSTLIEKRLNVSGTPAFGVAYFDGGILDEAGSAYNQAGGHPDSASTTFELNKRLNAAGFLEGDGGSLRNVKVDLPAGLAGNPTAMPQCSRSLAIPNSRQGPTFDPNLVCPANSIVGVADVTIVSSQAGRLGRGIVPVFNLEPPPGVPAQFGLNFAEQKVIFDAHIRSDGDYGVNVTARNASSVKAVVGSTVTLWGLPSDRSHDGLRCLKYDQVGNENAGKVQCDPDPATKAERPWNAPSAAFVKPTAFLTNPTACPPPGVGLETRIRVESWDPASPADEASFISHLSPGLPRSPSTWGAPQGPTGCEKVPFDPAFEVRADATKPDAPTGVAVDLSFPQAGLLNPVGLAPGHLKRATVTLPEGWSVSPSSADGLEGCTDAQSSVGTLLGAECPAASKIGTVVATTPLLDETLEGSVYVGSQESDDPLSGKMFRMFIALNSEERGIRVKLPGQIRINPGTGRIETTFDNNPQVPVDKISLRLKGGPRAPLATPLDCGTSTVTAELEAWSGQIVDRSATLTVDCPGAKPLAPSFSAGVTTNYAGRHTTFALRAERPDGQQVMDGLALRMPTGLLAKLRGVPRCDSAAADAGACPEASRVGTTTVGAGPGPNPFFLQGGVYLTGPYKRGPFGLAVAVRAKAGPFDLGTVVVRQQLLVDPIDAHVDVVSDPLPTMLKGVQIRLRSLNVDVDRPDFVLNPTSCAQKSVLAAFRSPDGSVFNASSPFGAANCAALPLKPKLSIALEGSGR